MTDKPFELGDVVVLKSGGDPMTVEKVHTTSKLVRKDGAEMTEEESILLRHRHGEFDENIYESHEEPTGKVGCVWFTQQDDLNRADLKIELLEPYVVRPAS